MWFWKKKKNRLTTEYNAMEESQKRMRIFEEKYNIRSIDVYNKTCDMSIFEGADKYLWETYIRSFIRCGGSLEITVEPTDNYDDNFECSILKDEMHNIKKNNEIKKETAILPFLFLLVQNM